MRINTNRFGNIDFDDNHTITFRNGLVGMPNNRHFTMLTHGDTPDFLWLQSIDDPALAFSVISPDIFIPNYHVPLKESNFPDIEDRSSDDFEFFALASCNKGEIFVNFRSPLAIHLRTRQAEQIILIEYNTLVRTRVYHLGPWQYRTVKHITRM